MLVADTSAIAHLYIPGEHAAVAAAAYRRDPDWVTVPLWRYEFVNVLWKVQRAGLCDASAAAKNFQAAVERLTPRQRSPDDLEALGVARQHKLSVYDAYFIALAQKLRLPLLTEDRELLAKFPGTAVSLEGFGSDSRN